MKAKGAAMKPNQGERGQDLAEFALIFPILFLIFMGIFDLGRAVYYASALHNAAREGARYGIINPDDVAGIADAAEAFAVGIPPDDLSIDSQIVPQADWDEIQVTVAYRMPIVTPIISAIVGGEIPLSSQAVMVIED